MFSTSSINFDSFMLLSSLFKAKFDNNIKINTDEPKIHVLLSRKSVVLLTLPSYWAPLVGDGP